MTNNFADDYFKAEKRPAEEVYNYQNIAFSSSSDDTLVFLRDEKTNDPIGWAIPNVLTNEECSQLVQEAELFGIHSSKKPTLRTAKRTTYYINQDLSNIVFPRIRSSMEERLKKRDDCGDNKDSNDVMTMLDGMGSLHHVHPNWRVVRYTPPYDSFPAHQDQMDSYQVKHPRSESTRLNSSHITISYAVFCLKKKKRQKKPRCFTTYACIYSLQLLIYRYSFARSQ